MTFSATCATAEISLRCAVTDSYDYDAFGNKINSTGTTSNVYMYRGEQFDPDLGLYYLRARYYNPATGRFLSRDPLEYKRVNRNRKPIEPRKLHKYFYAGGDPVNLVDPTGEGIKDYLAAVTLSVMLALGPTMEAGGEGELEHIEVYVEGMIEAGEESYEAVAPGGAAPPPWTGPWPSLQFPNPEWGPF